MLSSRSNCSTWTCQATVQQPASMVLASNTEWSRGGCGTLLVQCSTEQLTSRPCTSDAHSVTISPLLPACFSFRLRLQLGECCHWTRHTSTAVCLCSDWIRPGKVPVVPHEVFQCTNPHTPPAAEWTSQGLLLSILFAIMLGCTLYILAAASAKYGTDSYQVCINGLH